MGIINIAGAILAVICWIDIIYLICSVFHRAFDLTYLICRPFGSNFKGIGMALGLLILVLVIIYASMFTYHFVELFH